MKRKKNRGTIFFLVYLFIGYEHVFAFLRAFSDSRLKNETKNARSKSRVFKKK